MLGTNIFDDVLRYISTIALTDWLDIALMAYFLYRALRLVGRSRVAKLGRGVLVFLALLLLSNALKLNSINFVLTRIVTWGALALIVIFQPEIRRILEQLGSSSLGTFNPFARAQHVSEIETAVAQTVIACTEMSASHTGLLIVFERQLELDEIAHSGTIVDARVSSELLRNIFFVKAALHDGAVIIRDGRILAAGCILPLSHNPNISSDLGTRHRAGLGISENSDALVVIVSEETGAISVASRGMLKRHLSGQTLEKLLTNELMPQQPTDESAQDKFSLRALLQRVSRKEAGDDAAK